MTHYPMKWTQDQVRRTIIGLIEVELDRDADAFFALWEPVDDSYPPDMDAIDVLNTSSMGRVVAQLTPNQAEVLTELVRNKG